jgi:THO complex subunit 2
LEALLNVGDWPHAEAVMSNLPTYYAVAQPDVAAALCNLIHVTIDPVHKR